MQAVRQGASICIQEFTDDLRHRLWTVWSDVEGFNPQGTNSKLAAYQSLFAVPFDVDRLPRHLHLDLFQHVLQNVSRFRLRAYTLKAEMASWDHGNPLLCYRCACEEIQDEAHALLMRRDAAVWEIRKVCLPVQSTFSRAALFATTSQCPDGFIFSLAKHNYLCS